MKENLLNKISAFFEEQRAIKNDNLGLVVSYSKTHWPEVKKTLTAVLQTTLLAKGVVGLLKLDKVKVLSHLSNIAIVGANLMTIKEEHKEGIKKYRQDLLDVSRDEFINSLSVEERDELIYQSKVLAGIYHDRDSKDGLKKFRHIMEVWGDVFHGDPIDKDKFIELVGYLDDYYSKASKDKVSLE